MADAGEVRDRIQLVRVLSNELAAYIHALPDDVWRNAEQYASGCAEWKITDVVAHLIREAISMTQSISRARKGDLSSPMGFSEATEEEKVRDVISFRDMVYDELFAEFNATCRNLNNLLTELQPDDYGQPVWTPNGIVSTGRVVGDRLQELAIHGWDIRYGLDRSVVLAKDVVPFLKTRLDDWLQQRLNTSASQHARLTFRFNLEDSTAEKYDAVVEEAKFRLCKSSEHPADVEFHCDSNTFILFAMGRLPYARAVRRGRIRVEGDEMLAGNFTKMFDIR